MGSIDSELLLLTCGEHPHGSRRPIALEGAPTVALPARPGKADVDPVIAERRPKRLVVAGGDADLAAVLVRLLRLDRLDVEVAFLPAPGSDGARAWGLPTGVAAAALAVGGTASAVPLVRDDSGGVLVGRGEVRGMRGECYCDDVLVLRGTAPRLVVAPGPGGIAVRAGRLGRLPDGRIRGVPLKATRGRGSAVGRTAQLGGEPMTVVVDGVAHPREVRRWTWYRHTTDWLLVRPHP
ncbi:MAG: hypothetical protein QOG20_2723 [Pseudonocardiales bacterium]|nr:hypothetical protein [Pseudonocardiales bacterium]